MITFNIPYTIPLPTSQQPTTTTALYDLSYTKKITQNGLTIDWSLKANEKMLYLAAVVILLMYLFSKTISTR